MIRHLSALATVLVGCGSGGGTTGRPDAGGTEIGPGTRAYDAVAYELRGEFRWEGETLFANETISLILASTADAVVELDAAFPIDRAHAGDRDLPWAYDAAAQTLRVDLSSLGTTTAEFVLDYRAAPSGSLIVPTLGRAPDPVQSRVVFTDSEPDRGKAWLAANHRPSDRARWAVELTVADDEDVIANGTRVRDERVSGGRLVRYEMDQPIPTYLMAFAAGQLEHHDRNGRVPLAVWHRRGLFLDPERHLDVIAEAMAVFENLVGPYPFDRYSVVLLPQFGGGMENATITFNLESSGQGNISLSLNAHELAHHWFGDWVTVRDFDHLWIKEGMATLLAAEAQRARRDLEGKGRRFGFDFGFDPGDAIVDRSLHGLDKYTSGPYTRAAWLLTQIRAAVGEDAFWGSLRGVLAAHALGSIDSEGFVRSFAPALAEPQIQKILATLDRAPPPAIAVTSAADRQVTLEVSDPSGALIAPLDVTVVDQAGAAATSTLAVGTPTTLTVPAGGYLAPDETDVHPDWLGSFIIDRQAFYDHLAPLFVPAADAALSAFETRSAAHQERALGDWALPPFDATGLPDFYARLDSSIARRYAALDGCYTFKYLTDVGGNAASWATVLGPILADPSTQSFSSGFASCGTGLAADRFGVELEALVDSVTPATAGRFLYLMSFDYGPATSLRVLGPVAAVGPSLQLRDQALSRLVLQAEGTRGYAPVPVGEADAWRVQFRARLDQAYTGTRFLLIWRAVTALYDDGALALAGRKLHDVPLAAATQLQVVCDAYRIAMARQILAWTEFRDAAQPWTTLSPGAAAALEDPARCAAGKPEAPARVRDLPDSPAALRAERR